MRSKNTTLNSVFTPTRLARHMSNWTWPCSVVSIPVWKNNTINTKQNLRTIPRFSFTAHSVNHFTGKLGSGRKHNPTMNTYIIKHNHFN